MTQEPSPCHALVTGEAFAAVVGPLIEVPSLALLANAALALRRRRYGA